MSSILNDVKQAVGVAENNTEFEEDIIMAINSALFNLMQLGVGPPDGVEISNLLDDWEILFQGRQDLNAAKSYVFTVVRLIFDRPETSYGIQALERMRDEWAWRLEVQARNDRRH